MRSILPVSFLFLTVGCSAILEEKSSDTAGNLDDLVQTDTAEDTGEETDTVNSDTAVVDTGTPVAEPSGFIAEWVVTSENVTLDTFVLPRLLTHTNDTDGSYTVTELKVFIGAANAAWPTTIGDTRLGVGTTDQHIGVYERYDTFCGADADGNTYCSNGWVVDTTNSALTVNNVTRIEFGFSMALFSEDEMVAEIAELHDGVADLMRVYAVVSWTASNGTSGESTSEDFFTITPG